MKREQLANHLFRTAFEQQSVEPRAPKQVGAVITFPEGVTEADVRLALQHLSVEIEGATISTYNPQYGGPVWYVP